MCDRAVELGAKKREEIRCEGCRFIVPLMQENEEVVALLAEMGPALFAGGVLNADLVRLVMESRGIRPCDRPRLIAKIGVVFATTMEHARSKE